MENLFKSLQGYLIGLKSCYDQCTIMMREAMHLLEPSDPVLYACLQSESQRQHQHLELIASENYASAAVRAMQGSILTNKYAEGYPARRYYGGCHWVDEIEALAIERACQLFKCEYANVQPHSGSQANFAVYSALLCPGDLILGMDLNSGGHLTHGASVNASGQLYQSIAYGLNAEGDIDYDQVAQLAQQHQPKMIIAGFSAFSGIIDWARFRAIADEVGAYLLADIAHVSGLVAAGLYPSPIPHAHVVTSTTHKTLRGPRGGLILSGSDETLHKKLNFGVFPCTQGGPLMHVIAAKAVAFQEALSSGFKRYQQQVIQNAQTLVNALRQLNVQVVSNQTHNHMFLIDLSDQSFSGKVAEQWLESICITTNKNTIPGDQRSPFQTSGLRIGTPAVTSRGMNETAMITIAQWIAGCLNAEGDPVWTESVRDEVLALADQYPIPECYGE